MVESERRREPEEVGGHAWVCMYACVCVCVYGVDGGRWGRARGRDVGRLLRW